MFTEGKIIPRSEFADMQMVVEWLFSNPTDGMVYGAPAGGSYNDREESASADVNV